MFGPGAAAGGVSAVEFDLWAAYHGRNGFRTDRLAWGVARAGAATAGAMGAKVQPADLIPRFHPAAKSPKAMLAYLKTIPGAEVRTYG